MDPADDQPPDGNQHEHLCTKLQPQIRRTRAALAAGTAPSRVANELLRVDGLGTIAIILVFCEATGASLGDVQALGHWWNRDTGVTAAGPFDEWARRAFAK
ncbi:MAG: hypothetical protein IPL61_27300 [Myxococcales bacterium]|nr:hypothetical protein [Myxococcales bacterium]